MKRYSSHLYDGFGDPIAAMIEDENGTYLTIPDIMDWLRKQSREGEKLAEELEEELLNNG